MNEDYFEIDTPFANVSVCVAYSPGAWDALLEDWDIREEIDDYGFDYVRGQVYDTKVGYSDSRGLLVAVGLNPRRIGSDPEEFLWVCVHEAVHVVRAIYNYICSSQEVYGSSIAEESEAYLMEHIVAGLYLTYKENS